MHIVKNKLRENPIGKKPQEKKNHIIIYFLKDGPLGVILILICNNWKDVTAISSDELCNFKDIFNLKLVYCSEYELQKKSLLKYQ